MNTTYFRPSIHGWPFRNSWKYSLQFSGCSLPMGYCGGMCWTALQRFYEGILIDRGTQAPPQGHPLYNEISSVQFSSTSPTKVEKIYEWQLCPDLGKNGLGDRTQKEWQTVKGYLDAFKPVTLTLIVHSNTIRPWLVKDHHRVVAYAYAVRPVNPTEGAPSGADYHVTIYIYDPNHENNDDIRITFFTGGNRNKIRIRQNTPGDEVHGFFLDDVDRSYASLVSTKVWIDKCGQTAIKSATKANYDLQFSWKCSFIPYFCIQVNDVDLPYDSVFYSNYEPKTKPNKQCQARTGSITINLELSRVRCKVAVRLLDTNNYYQSVEVDAEPAILCYPYVDTRALSDGPQVCDTAIKDADHLYIKDPAPSEAALQSLADDPFRWIIIEQLPSRVIDTRGPNDDLSIGNVKVFDSYRLGNLKVPVYANIVERNLDANTKTSGDVRTIKPGNLDHTTHLTTLANQAQKIFDGFAANNDYNDGTRVEFTYQSKEDLNGLVVYGKTTFYGISIIHKTWTVELHTFDLSKLSNLEAVARELVERGLIGIAIGLRKVRDPRLGSLPASTDRIDLMAKLRSHLKLQDKIDQTLNLLWGDSDVWRACWKAQEKLMKQVGKGRPILIGKPAKAGDVLKTILELRETEQRKYDDVIVNLFVVETLKRLREMADLNGLLKSL